jgi:hypothetical protein
MTTEGNLKKQCSKCKIYYKNIFLTECDSKIFCLICHNNYLQKKGIEEMKKPLENSNCPLHYQGKSMEVIQVIEDFDLNFNLGHAIQYILRAGKKGYEKEDLQKAMWYINREIESK